MDAERAALANEAVHQQRRFLGELIVFSEEFLELVDNEQDARQRFAGMGVAIVGHILHATGAVHFAAAAQLFVKAFEHADAELPLAFDGDHPRVR